MGQRKGERAEARLELIQGPLGCAKWPGDWVVSSTVIEFVRQGTSECQPVLPAIRRIASE